MNQGGLRGARFRRASISIVVAASLLGLSVRSVLASTLYGTSGQIGSPSVYTVNQSTGAATSLGSIGFNSIADMTSDWRPQSFRLWAISDGSNQVLRVDPTTGAGTAVGSFTSGIHSLAFDVITGVMYAVNAGRLYRVNPDTAATTLVGNLGASEIGALGFDLAGNLFGVTVLDSTLVRINTATASVTTVGPTGVNAMVDIACRPEDGVMFGVATIGSSSIFTLNTSTGAATLVGPYNLPDGINGLAFSPVPEPASVALMILGLLPLRQRRLRRPSSTRRAS